MSSTSVSAAASSAPDLDETAEYGKLPFDRFVLDHWEYERRAEDDHQQWNELAKRWLSMDHLGRSPYHKIASELQYARADDHRMPTQEQINRVLVPYQTVDERNRALCVLDCLWLRTCYEPSLAEAYEEMTQHIQIYPDEPSLILNDENLYNFNEDWLKIFLRMPQLPDVVAYCGNPELEDKDIVNEMPEDEALLPAWGAEVKWRSVHYLLDREAQQKKLAKVIWLDLHGNCIWWNWMIPTGSEIFEARWHGIGKGFAQVTELCETHPECREKGALLSTID